MPFGRYRGWSLARIAATDPGYLEWVATPAPNAEWAPKNLDQPRLREVIRCYLRHACRGEEVTAPLEQRAPLPIAPRSAQGPETGFDALPGREDLARA